MLKNQAIFVRKLEYLSKYRGCKESEIIFTKFAENYLPKLTIEELKDYELILEETDAVLLDWFMYKKDTPAKIRNNKVYDLILESMYG